MGAQLSILQLFYLLYEFFIALLCMVVGNTHHGPKSCRHPSNKCELKNEADNTLYDFAHRKENKPRQQQGDEKAHRVSYRGERSRSCTRHQKKETGSFKSFPPVWEPLDARHHLVRTRHRYTENQQPPSSRYEIAREHHPCGIEGTSARSWHLVPGFE